MNEPKLRNAALRLLSLAFPSNSSVTQAVYDSERARLEREMIELQQRYSMKSWREIDASILVKPLDSALLLTDEAFNLLFPAYLKAALSDDLTSSEVTEICEIVRWSIPLREDSQNGDDPLRDDWWLALTWQQRIAVVTVVVAAYSASPSRLGPFMYRWAQYCAETLDHDPGPNKTPQNVE